MEYGDESVIKILNSSKIGTTGDLETGIYINEELYMFQRNLFFDEKLSVLLPESFVDLPESIMKLKYPSEQRPQIIKTNKAGGINFAFSLVDIPFQEDMVIEYRDNLKNILKNMNPSMSFGELKKEEVSGTFAGWFEFQNHVFDGILYNIMYCMPLDGKMLHGIFNCMLQDMPFWKEVAIEVIKSIVDTTKELDKEVR
ncbi:hypothetical protein [Anaeromicropila populeti]|uniref:Uncharacterized protein n=1 Tax=Anaeromicropila populeti TaxID=37658 RepID=A0A1I6IMK4_9FIRM|nr:hypothetical protein [Anaeromicropila populeti]SFR67946.1 hypothetical protein SAMN05661086_00908 [Anaeromicropila populeti]